MSNYQQQQDEYGQQHSIQSGFNASGLSMEESVSPMYSVQQQQYPTPGSYYSPPQHNSDMYSQGQGVLIDFVCSLEKVTSQSQLCM